MAFLFRFETRSLYLRTCEFNLKFTYFLSFVLRLILIRIPRGIHWCLWWHCRLGSPSGDWCDSCIYCHAYNKETHPTSIPCSKYCLQGENEKHIECMKQRLRNQLIKFQILFLNLDFIHQMPLHFENCKNVYGTTILSGVHTMLEEFKNDWKLNSTNLFAGSMIKKLHWFWRQRDLSRPKE